MSRLTKKSNNEFTLMITIIALAIFVIEILAISFAFFEKNTKVTGQITLGELDYDIVVNSSLENKTIMPSDNVDLNVSIINSVGKKSNLIPFYFRFQILNGEDNFDKDFVVLENDDDFIYDNYYFYYKYKLKFNEEAKLIKQIQIPSYFTEQDAQNFDLQLEVDAIQSEHGAYKDVFYDAPSEWLRFIENG